MDFRDPIRAELAQFNMDFPKAFSSKVALLDLILRYIVRQKGKQLRPSLVFLVAKALGEVSERTFRGATLVELMHTATLVHDDVVDESSVRRSMFSINALWKNKIAVLVGDYMLSRVLLLAVESGDHDLLRTVSSAVRAMSEGELLQIEKARRLDIDESVYYDIIQKKTASLMASCSCSCCHWVSSSRRRCWAAGGCRCWPSASSRRSRSTATGARPARWASCCWRPRWRWCGCCTESSAWTGCSRAEALGMLS